MAIIPSYIFKITSILSNHGIGTLEEKLNPQNFIRVHRSSIITLKLVKELNKYGKTYDVSMQNGDVVRVSRGYKEKLDKLLFNLISYSIEFFSLTHLLLALLLLLVGLA